jgi:hypothetical protein
VLAKVTTRREVLGPVLQTADVTVMRAALRRPDISRVTSSIGFVYRDTTSLPSDERHTSDELEVRRPELPAPTGMLYDERDTRTSPGPPPRRGFFRNMVWAGNASDGVRVTRAVKGRGLLFRTAATPTAW